MADIVASVPELRDEFGQLDFTRRRGSERSATLADDVHQGVSYRECAVSEDQRSPRTDIVDIGSTIDVGHRGPVTSLDEYGISPHGLEGANRRVHPSRNDHLGAFEQRIGLRHAG
jgi:hypothetical protein